MKSFSYWLILMIFILAITGITSWTIHFIIRTAKAGSIDSATVSSPRIYPRDRYVYVNTSNLATSQTDPSAGIDLITCPGMLDPTNITRLLVIPTVMIGVGELSEDPKPPTRLADEWRLERQDKNYYIIPKCNIVYTNWSNPYCDLSGNPYAANYNRLDQVNIQCAPITLRWETVGANK